MTFLTDCSSKSRAVGDVVEDAEVVHDQAVGLSRVQAVGAADGLQETVVAHGLVQVHGLEDRGVEAREELGGDDQELEGIQRDRGTGRGASLPRPCSSFHSAYSSALPPWVCITMAEASGPTISSRARL